jgi:hypothetical protein
MPATISQKKAALLLNIIWVGLLTGTLDALAALILNYKTSAAIIFRFIASGLFGKAAFTGGSEMIISGVVFHFLIAYLFTTAYYLIYPFFKSTLKNKYVIALVYGIFAWLIMNLLVVPVSKIGMHPIKPMNIVTGVLALIICIGLPIALLADRYYSKTR